MQQVRAKKHLGQHFLKDERIAKEIADSLSGEYPCVLEIGPGMGVLTKYLIVDPKVKELKVVEIDKEIEEAKRTIDEQTGYILSPLVQRIMDIVPRVIAVGIIKCIMQNHLKRMNL